MSASLAVIAGPLTGEIIPLDGDTLSIGRGSSNQLSIADLGLSRLHCVIDSEQGRPVLRDLDSLNGTFVNGLPVKERALQHADQIRIGDSIFLFLSKDPTDGTPPAVELAESDAARDATVALRQEDVLYLQSEQILASFPPPRLARDLRALFKVSTGLAAVRDRDTLVRELLDRIFEAVPADCGAILLAGAAADRFEETYGRHRQSDGPVPVSRMIARRVLLERISVLSNKPQDDFQSSHSVVAAQVQSALCVPLIAVDRVLGVVYLATTTPATQFDQDHLQLITAIAGVAALALDNLSRFTELEEETRRLQADLLIERTMVGESARMRTVYDVIARVAPTDATVLILGESGTGKELAARAIHENSSRKGRPFAAVNCAALTESLLESELFGHEKGAFTGALAQKKGRLELAEGGTVFLDEIGELAPALQVKLLRVLQEREFERVGGTKPIKIDTRIVAATNRRIDEAVRTGAFRKDLYYRLNVVAVTMPPLRERREDIPLLAAYFVSKYAHRCKRRVTGVSSPARKYLLHYDWPGNVRELENAIERAVVLGASEMVLPEDLPEAVLEAEVSSGPEGSGYHIAIREAKKRVVIRAMEQAEGSYADAARSLGLHPNNLHRLIRTLDLRAELGR